MRQPLKLTLLILACALGGFARPAAAKADLTLATELSFPPGSSAVDLSTERALRNFLRDAKSEGRLRSLKVLVFASPGGTTSLERARLDELKSRLASVDAPVSFTIFSEREPGRAERDQAALLAVLE